jgi:tetratricopeptide (TPR) repeat protein
MLERPEEAIIAFLKALKIEPDFFEGHHNLGNAYQDMNRLEEAVECYHQALALNPDFEESQRNLGTCLLGCGSHQEGLKYLQQSCGVIEFTSGDTPECRLLHP